MKLKKRLLSYVVFTVFTYSSIGSNANAYCLELTLSDLGKFISHTSLSFHITPARKEGFNLLGMRVSDKISIYKNEKNEYFYNTCRLSTSGYGGESVQIKTKYSNEAVSENHSYYDIEMKIELNLSKIYENNQSVFRIATSYLSCSAQISRDYSANPRNFTLSEDINFQLNGNQPYPIECEITFDNWSEPTNPNEQILDPLLTKKFQFTNKVYTLTGFELKKSVVNLKDEYGEKINVSFLDFSKAKIIPTDNESNDD